MKEKLDFSEVPYQYSMCLNRQCPKADICLRQLAEQSIPEKVEHWTIISPKRLTTTKGDCPYYRSNIKASYAKGFIGILESLPHLSAQGKTKAVFHNPYHKRRIPSATNVLACRGYGERG